MSKSRLAAIYQLGQATLQKGDLVMYSVVTKNSCLGRQVVPRKTAKTFVSVQHTHS